MATGGGSRYCRGIDATRKKDADGNLSVWGTSPDPMQGEVSYRMVSTITGKDTYTYEMFATSPEGETRVMEILYTRVKS